MNQFPLSAFTNITLEGYTFKRNGQRYSFLDQLKKSCLFGDTGVLAAFSCAHTMIPIRLSIGRIHPVILSELIPETMSKNNLVIIAASKTSAIQGDVYNGECVFPHLQHYNSDQINVTCSAFNNCPSDYSPQLYQQIYIAFSSPEPSIKLLHKALWEFSQNNANSSIIFLYASMEAAATKLSGIENGRVSTRLSSFAKSIKVSEPNFASIVKSIKRKIENTIVEKRNLYAHHGHELQKDDLLHSFAVALEFFWHFDRFLEFSLTHNQQQ